MTSSVATGGAEASYAGSTPVAAGNAIGRARGLVGAANGHAHPVVLDLDLPHARFLDDLHELANTFPALGVRVLGDEHAVPRVPRPDDLQQLLGVRAEHRDQDELLLGRGEAFRLLAHVLRRHRVLRQLRPRREQLDRALDGRVDGLRRDAVPALDELAELVDDGPVAPRLEHVEKRLGGQDLPDRRRQRRPAGLGPDPPHLLEHLEQPIGRGMGAQMDVERRHEAGREVELGRAHGDSRSNVRDRLVADVLVDDVGGFPQLPDVEARCVAEALQRLRHRLAGDAMERQREWVDRGRDEIGPRVDRGQGGREADARGALDVEADRAARSPP